jgi:hypothetical protein
MIEAGLWTAGNIPARRLTVSDVARFARNCAAGQFEDLKRNHEIHETHEKKPAMEHTDYAESF